MNRYLDLSLEEIHNLLVEKTITPVDLVKESLARIEENKDLNAFITINEKEYSYDFDGSSSAECQSGSCGCRCRQSGSLC